jgi:large subunit ribosomal protein L6
MSRVGKKPIQLPKGVSISSTPAELKVKGPKGELKRHMPEGISVKVDGQTALVARADDSRPNRAKHGLVRALLQNMVTGVSAGFVRELEINGVGYRAEVKGKALQLLLGYSHPIDFALPTGIEAKVDKNKIVLSGIDRELLGQTAAKIRDFRGPEPYKGKGIKYVEETIRRKVGKTGAS